MGLYHPARRPNCHPSRQPNPLTDRSSFAGRQDLDRISAAFRAYCVEAVTLGGCAHESIDFSALTYRSAAAKEGQ
jgi:hypothetical protein